MIHPGLKPLKTIHERAGILHNRSRQMLSNHPIGGSSKQGRCNLVHVIYSFGGIVHVVNVGGSKARLLYKQIDCEFCGNVEKRVHYTLFSWYCSLAYKTPVEQYEACVKTITYAREALGDPSIKQAVVDNPDLPFLPEVDFQVKLSCF